MNTNTSGMSEIRELTADELTADELDLVSGDRGWLMNSLMRHSEAAAALSIVKALLPGGKLL